MVNEQKGFFRRTGEALGFIVPVTENRGVDGPAAGVIPPARSDISSISVEQALSIGAVYRCVSILTASISQMPLGVYRDGIEIKTPTIVKNPNIDESQRQFIKQTVWSLSTHGNAYWRVYGDYPNIQNLEVLDPTQVTVQVDPKTGKKTYWLGTSEIRNIKHLKLMSKPGCAKGYGPIQYGQSELIGAFKVRNFADTWFNGSVPQGMLTTDQVLGPEESAAFAAAFEKFVRENGIAVMSAGLSYEHLNIKPADAQYLEVQQAQTVAIARLFGVPTTLLASGNEGTSNTYMNQQELFMQFLQTTLTDYMNEIEDALSSLLPRGQEVNFKEDALLRMNTSLEVDVQVKQIAAGLRTPDELRAADGLEPLSEGYEIPMSKNPNTNAGASSNGDS